ncbi:MAG: HAD family hydrolase, partial [Actinobacteria bacterium]|nr:HAD family hydrolase [Actinomycetota bacterium]
DANDDWELTQRLCAAAGVEVPLETITERFEQIYQGTTERSGLKRSERPIVAAEILAELSARMPLGIVTGRPRSDAEEFLERFELTRYFAAVVTRESGPLKPDPSPVRLVLEQLDVERAWMLGDTPDDLEAALAAGVVPVAVVPPGSDPDRYRRMLAGAAGVLDSTNQILEVLNGQKS